MKKQNAKRLDAFQTESLSPRQANQVKGGTIGVEDIVEG